MTTQKTPGPPKPIFDESTLEWSAEHAACLRAFMAGWTPKIKTQDVVDLCTEMNPNRKYSTMAPYFGANTFERKTIQESMLSEIMQALRDITGNYQLSQQDVFGVAEVKPCTE